MLGDIVANYHARQTAAGPAKAPHKMLVTLSPIVTHPTRQTTAD